MQPGFYSGLSLSDYHAAPGLSKSDLDLIARSPAHYRHGDREETPARRLGTAAHACVLEPETWEHRYARAQGRRRVDTATDRTVLTAAEWDTCLRLRDAVWNHPTCQDLLSDGTAESSAWWLDPETRLLCKCRPDWSRPGLLLDLKTTMDASPAGFARAVERYRYHVQAAYALDGWRAAGGSSIERFLLVAVEKTAPFAVALYDLPAAALTSGRALYRRDLATASDCLSRQHWPGYDPAIVTLPLGNTRPEPGPLLL
jgi:exodeoxyribonuclease VIII